MDKKEVEWLYRQLPGLVAKGIIPPESAERIKTHYGPVDGQTGTRTFLIVFGIVGMALVGLGIILILAHNWAELTRVNRLIISLAILAGAQAIAGIALWFKQDSRVWREAAATFLLLMVGASLALVGQTYHLTEATDAFLLTWMLLALPLIYLLNSATAAAMYLAGITVWVMTGYFDPGKHLIWVLLGLVLPYYWRLLRAERGGNAAAIVSWLITLSFYLCFVFVFSHTLESLSLLVYSALFGTAYLLGVLQSGSGPQGWQQPFTVTGLAGTCGLTFILTFKSVWSHLNINSQVQLTGIVLAVALLALVAILNVRLAGQRGRAGWQFGLIPLVAAAGYLLQWQDSSGLSAALLLNAYLLGLSLNIINTGVRERSLGIANAGMLLLAALIVARFLDMNFSFVARGLAFVLLGSGFLTANLIMVRRKARGSDDKK